jgi:NADPH:quinone reductase-like Zn-dependent oxidoreductase
VLIRLSDASLADDLCAHFQRSGFGCDPAGGSMIDISRPDAPSLEQEDASSNFTFVSGRRRQEDLEELRELLEAGKVTPVVDRTFPLSEAPDAIRYLREGRARGKVVITV